MGQGYDQRGPAAAGADDLNFEVVGGRRGRSGGLGGHKDGPRLGMDHLVGLLHPLLVVVPLLEDSPGQPEEVVAAGDPLAGHKAQLGAGLGGKDRVQGGQKAYSALSNL